ncbi:MAG: pentapeptide repeat-containing protein [Crocosphaera sp.]
MIKETATALNILSKVLPLLTKERDPLKQGYYVCMSAYNFAVKEVLKQAKEDKKLEGADFRVLDATDEFISPKNLENIDMSGFTLQGALSHSFTNYADETFKKLAPNYGINTTQIDRLMTDIHTSFSRNLRLVLTDARTAEKVEGFRNLMILDNSQLQLQEVLCAHGYYQSWLYNTAKVFKEEAFSLSKIYLETDCGDLKWSEIKPQSKHNQSNRFHQEPLIPKKNPFSETDSQRVNLLSTVLNYFEDPKFKEPIVIQGIAGAGKSSFTLHLAHILREKGCTPIRVLLKDIINLNQNLLETIPKSLRFGEEGMDNFKYDPEFDPEWLRELINRNEVIYFGEKRTEISPYVFIFDGWDEIRTEASQGFKESIEKVLKNIRNVFIEQRGKRPPIRMIVTGRPSRDVSDTGFLCDSTPILTLKPLTHTQLDTYIKQFQDARQNSNAADQTLEPKYIDIILNTYKKEFEQLVKQHERGNVSDINGSLAVLGLPLLAYLTLRLLFKVESEEALQSLIHNPTNLYRALIDETCEGSGNPSFTEDLSQERYRLSGYPLRRLLWQTAQAITAMRKETISRNELWLRIDQKELKDNLESIVKKISRDDVLSPLIISFFFKENTGEGCEFVHKSFREYLFAEAIVERLKAYGQDRKVIKQYEQDPEKGFPEREKLWQNFDSSDPRYDLTRNLSKCFATAWLSPEIRTHLLNILTWEINRASEITESSSPTPLDRWGYIRDALADTWDWWAADMVFRSQPKENEYNTPEFDPPYLLELAKLCSPLDRQVWENELPEPEGGHTINARLGDAFFHLTAIVHGLLYQCATKELSDSVKFEKPQHQRRYQTVAIAKDEKDKEITLIQFAPSGKDSQYFHTLINRINAVETRPQGQFPIYIWGVGINLYRANLYRANLYEAYLEGAYLEGAYLEGAYLEGANLYRAYLEGANFYGAYLEGANFYGAYLEGAYLEGAYLEGARYLTVEQIQEAKNNGEDAIYDEEMGKKLGLEDN